MAAPVSETRDSQPVSRSTRSGASSRRASQSRKSSNPPSAVDIALQKKKATIVENESIEIEPPARTSSLPVAETTPPKTAVKRPSPPSRKRTDESVPRMFSSSSVQRPRRDDSSSAHYVNSQFSNETGLTKETDNTSVNLAPLQATQDLDDFKPVENDDPQSYDLVVPAANEGEQFQLEQRSKQLFSKEHLKMIFSDPKLLVRFTTFLSDKRPQSVPLLKYYLDTLKAIKALTYANALVGSLNAVDGLDFTNNSPEKTANRSLETRANEVFEVMVREDLPAFIAHVYIKIVTEYVSKRVMGTLAPPLREASDGLAEVFCLTDPSRSDNPIVLASEEFYRTTQYGVGYAIGRNCRFLQGPNTNRDSVRRLKQACEKGVEANEVFLNYRRDGSPFVNLLMMAPLVDDRGKIRYFIGAQVDVSGLVRDATDMESLLRLDAEKLEKKKSKESSKVGELKDSSEQFREMSEMFSTEEIEMVRIRGGRMHNQTVDGDRTSSSYPRPRLLVKESGGAAPKQQDEQIPRSLRGRLSGVYQNYLLVRPYPSLRILFASPTLRLPGILQSRFMSRVGGSTRVHDELLAAFAAGRLVTARIRWLTRFDDDGRLRWIHCTPLMGANDEVGAWMVVLVDDDREKSSGGSRRWKHPPPVHPPPSSGPPPVPDKEGDEGLGRSVSGATGRKRGSTDVTSNAGKSERSFQI